ncbi:hypothetical protein FOA52_009600 [Chlamydomonas sp. UWO 241]|nr:hypothetical protein FOA52_009600 [Chlamydomonas sp. UWO 241]
MRTPVTATCEEKNAVDVLPFQRGGFDLVVVDVTAGQPWGISADRLVALLDDSTAHPGCNANAKSPSPPV